MAPPRTPRRRLAVIGWGRLGRACAEGLHDAPGLALAGIVRRPQSLDASSGSPLHGVACVSHVRELDAVDIALLCVPGAAALGVAIELMQSGLPVVECAQLEGDALGDHHKAIAHGCHRHRVGAVVGAGWDAGVLPDLRQLFERLIPRGRTDVAQHVAASLHHTAAARGLAGVQAALCSEVHDRDGARRYVYVQLAPGADVERIRERIEADPLFADTPTQVLAVDDLAALERESRGVLIERLGEGAGGPHASLILEARCDPVGFTARLMLDAACRLPLPGRQAWRYTPFGLVPWDGLPSAGP